MNLTEHGLGGELRMAVVLVLVLSTLPRLQKGDVQNGLLVPAENVPYASSVLPPLLSSLPLSQISKGKGKDDQQGERVEVDVYTVERNG